MFKQIIALSLITGLVLSGCKDHNNAGFSSSAGSGAAMSSTIVVNRDRSINQSNAFNDIFLDSADLENFIVQEKLNDTFSTALRSFYNARNFEYSWFTSTGLIEQAYSFHSLCCTDNEKDVFNRTLERRLDRLRVPDDSVVAINPKDAANIKTELQITEKFIQYAMENFKDYNITAEYLGTYIPAKKTAVLALADSILADNDKNKNYFAVNESYRLLKDPLQKYCTLAKSGGWPVITAGKKEYAVGDNRAEIATIKKRLQLTGELTGTDTSTVFTPELQNAVKTYQQDNGYKPTGDILAALIKDMNIPALTRVQQLLINMQRMRWMPDNLKGRLIKVNIPEFELYMDSAKDILFRMDVVVGAEGHNTTMFSGNLSQVVFSPYWNVPPNIVKKEILPGIKRNKNYLEEKDMEITGQEGGLPVVRQLPGPKNSLGKVKFLFPNSFDIYLHDTPDKGLFNRSARDMSHGCIRLSDPVKLANYMLRDNPTWTPEKIDSAMNSGVEQFVQIKNPVPVIITYYTAWVDDKGALHFAGDIYRHDTKMAAKMFTNPQ